MLVLSISDLHIDNGDNFGAFGWNASDFINTLNRVIDHYSVDQVVLNGDILDLYKYTYHEVSQTNSKLINYLQSRKCIFIRGNHDLLSPVSQDHHLIINSNGNKIYFEHGHNADFLNGTRFGRTLGKFGFSVLKRLIHFPKVERFYFRLTEYTDEVKRIPRKYNTYKYLKYALKLLHKYDMVIMGHTHKLESHKMYYLNKKKIYLNSGSCSLGRFQAIILDTESLDFEIIKISKKKKIGRSDLPVFKK